MVRMKAAAVSHKDRAQQWSLSCDIGGSHCLLGPGTTHGLQRPVPRVPVSERNDQQEFTTTHETRVAHMR